MLDFSDDDREWKPSAKGNYVCIDSNDIVATVFGNHLGIWQIIINTDAGGRLVQDEHFQDPDAGIERAEEILDGADCSLSEPGYRPRAETTLWKMQKKQVNGQATYGRREGSLNVSVRAAKNGKWYFITYDANQTSEPQGWYRTAEDAMAAFDRQ